MADTIRTFLGVEVPVTPGLQSLRDELTALGRTIRPATRPLHLTLKFLGETRRTQLKAIPALMEDVAASHPAGSVLLRSIGAFPRIERPAVVWAGVTPAEPLSALAGALDARLATLGFPRESREFRAHVTLARVTGRPPAALSELLELYADEPFGSLHVSEFHLYQSQQTPRGTVYSVLRTAPLAEAR